MQEGFDKLREKLEELEKNGVINNLEYKNDDKETITFKYGDKEYVFESAEKNTTTKKSPGKAPSIKPPPPPPPPLPQEEEFDDVPVQSVSNEEQVIQSIADKISNGELTDIDAVMENLQVSGYDNILLLDNQNGRREILIPKGKGEVFILSFDCEESFAAAKSTGAPKSMSKGKSRLSKAEIKSYNYFDMPQKIDGRYYSYEAISIAFAGYNVGYTADGSYGCDFGSSAIFVSKDSSDTIVSIWDANYMRERAIYNSSGFLSSRSHYNSQGKETGFEVYLYNIDSDENVLYTTVAHYDENAKPYLYEYLDSEGNDILGMLYESINGGEDFWGRDTTKDNVEEVFNLINSDNVSEILDRYKRAYERNLITDLFDKTGEWFIHRADMARSVVAAMVEFAEKNGVYVDDIKEFLEDKIFWEEWGIGKMDGREIDYQLERLQDRIDASKGLDQSKNIEADGRIDADSVIMQSYTGDCWLLSYIIGLMSSQEGLEFLNSIISKDNKTGDILVKVQEHEYRITQDELNGSSELSRGDLDVRAIEIAVNKYLHSQHEYRNKDIDNGGGSALAFNILMGEGKLLDEIKSTIPVDDNYIEAIKSGAYKGTAGTYGKGNDALETGRYAKTKDGKQIPIFQSHSYTIKGIENGKVVLVDPHDSTVDLYLNLSDFRAVFVQGCLFSKTQNGWEILKNKYANHEETNSDDDNLGNSLKDNPPLPDVPNDPNYPDKPNINPNIPNQGYDDPASNGNDSYADWGNGWTGGYDVEPEHGDNTNANANATNSTEGTGKVKPPPPPPTSGPCINVIAMGTLEGTVPLTVADYENLYRVTSGDSDYMVAGKKIIEVPYDEANVMFLLRQQFGDDVDIYIIPNGDGSFSYFISEKNLNAYNLILNYLEQLAKSDDGLLASLDGGGYVKSENPLDTSNYTGADGVFDFEQFLQDAIKMGYAWSFNGTSSQDIWKAAQEAEKTGNWDDFWKRVESYDDTHPSSGNGSNYSGFTSIGQLGDDYQYGKAINDNDGNGIDDYFDWLFANTGMVGVDENPEVPDTKPKKPKNPPPPPPRPRL